MEPQSWRKEPRKNYPNDFKLRMVELASRPGACVAQKARENGVNDSNGYGFGRMEAAYHAAFQQQSNLHHHR